MEIFPSMSYQDVMNMPFREFKMLHQIRINRKLKEQDEAEKQRKEIEKKNEQLASRNAIRRSK